VHEASFEKVRAFKSTYVTPHDRPLRVLDVGSGAGPGSLTYRDLFPSPGFEYVGLDIEPGHNVDLVPEDPFCWSEIDSETFDLVISGQSFEHNPFFWITAAETARVLVEGGMAVVIAPSDGYPHRYPLDCWRFYPDSWPSICAYVGLELVESYREKPYWRKTIPGTYWRDAMMVARKSPFSDASERSSFYARIDAIVATRTMAPSRAGRVTGAGRQYDAIHTLAVSQAIVRPDHLGPLLTEWVRKVTRSRLAVALRRRVSLWDGRRALRRGESALRPASSPPLRSTETEPGVRSRS